MLGIAGVARAPIEFFRSMPTANAKGYGWSKGSDRGAAVGLDIGFVSWAAVGGSPDGN